MVHSDCGWTCGCAGKTVRSLENTCHTWALLRWWFTMKRRYIKCMHLYLLPLMIYALPITAESEGEGILKIGQHLPKLWARIKVGVFFWTECRQWAPVNRPACECGQSWSSVFQCTETGHCWPSPALEHDTLSVTQSHTTHHHQPSRHGPVGGACSGRGLQWAGLIVGVAQYFTAESFSDRPGPL